jgi:hypothetical protein
VPVDGKRSVALFMSVDVEVAGSGPCIEPKDAFLDLKTFLKMRFISMMIKVEENSQLHKSSCDGHTIVLEMNVNELYYGYYHTARS